MTQTMSVLSILQTANASCDFSEFDGSPETWMQMIMHKSNDTGFGRLVDSILENGWEEGSAIGLQAGAYISEGHHRLVAAILLGLDEVPVEDWGGNPDTLCAHYGNDGLAEFAGLFDEALDYNFT